MIAMDLLHYNATIVLSHSERMKKELLLNMDFCIAKQNVEHQNASMGNILNGIIP